MGIATAQRRSRAIMVSMTDDNQRQEEATERRVSPSVAAEARVIELLESENEFLRGQIAVKYEQIKDLAEHGRSTNLVIAGLAHKLPLLGVSDRVHDEARTYNADQSD